MRTLTLFRVVPLLGLASLHLPAASPSIIVDKVERMRLPGTGGIVQLVSLRVAGAPVESLQPPLGGSPPPARVSVLPVAPGASRDHDCENLVAPFQNPPGNAAAAVLLDARVVACLEKAWKDPDAYLAPTLLLPSLEYKGKPTGPVSLAIPNDLLLEEDPDASVIDAARLVFKVIYRPWQAESNEDIWQRHFLDPTAWCVSSGADAGKCAAHLNAYRKALACATSPGDDKCWEDVKNYLRAQYAAAVGRDAAARVERDWATRVQSGSLGCKDLPLPMAVSHAAFDADAGTLTLTFCRANFRAMQSATDDFRVVWLGESQMTAAERVPQPGKLRSVDAPMKRMSSTGQPANHVAAFRSLGQFEPRQRPEGIRFSAANPKTPAANQLYVEAFIRSDRAAFPPDPSPADYPVATAIPPQLSTRQLYGFRIEGTLVQLGDVRPLRDARNWSVHVLPSISALFNSGALAEDPNTISLKIPLEIRRTIADRGCRFSYGTGTAAPGRNCASPSAVQYVNFTLPAVLESTKTGTTKNLVFTPGSGFTLRPMDAAGARFILGANAAFAVGKRMTEVQFPGEKAKAEHPNGILRFVSTSALAVKPASPPFERFTLSVEYKFSQLFRNEIHSSPGDFLIVKDRSICAANLVKSTDAGCVIGPEKGMFSNFAKGTRQWLNAQVTFDVSSTFSVIVAYRKGRLEPLWVYTNQVSAGLAFHLDAKAKPKSPF